MTIYHLLGQGKCSRAVFSHFITSAVRNGSGFRFPIQVRPSFVKESTCYLAEREGLVCYFSVRFVEKAELLWVFVHSPRLNGRNPAFCLLSTVRKKTQAIIANTAKYKFAAISFISFISFHFISFLSFFFSFFSFLSFISFLSDLFTSSRQW